MNLNESKKMDIHKILNVLTDSLDSKKAWDELIASLEIAGFATGKFHGMAKWQQMMHSSSASVVS